MGEGAGCLVLERGDLARARGAKIYGYVVGYGASNDVFHMTQPDETGMGATKVMRFALADAWSGPVGRRLHQRARHVHAVQRQDRDARRLHNVFNGGSPPASSTKSAIGHLLGAAGAVEAVAALERSSEGSCRRPLTLRSRTPIAI